MYVKSTGYDDVSVVEVDDSGRHVTRPQLLRILKIGFIQYFQLSKISN